MSGMTSLRSRPGRMTPRQHEVHVWSVDLDACSAMRHALLRSLSEDERVRAQRFHFERERHRFVAARGALRAILGQYLDVKAEELRFTYGPHGKPALEEDSAPERLRFNLTHSEGLALIAVTLGIDVGVDVESLSSMQWEEIAERFLSAQEIAVLETFAGEERQHAFMACWTGKEAYVKARGESIAMLLDRTAAPTPGDARGFMRTTAGRMNVSRWSLEWFAPAHGYLAAVCAEGNEWRLSELRWPEHTSGSPPCGARASESPRKRDV